MMRQAVGVGIERGVGQRAVLEDHRHRIRRAQGLRRKQRGQGCRQARRQGCGKLAGRLAGVAPAAAATSRAVSFQARRMVSRSAAPRMSKAPSARLPSAAARASSRMSRSPEPGHARLLEQVACVFQHAVDPGRLAARRAPLDQPQRQVELGAAGCDRLRLHREPRQFQRAPAAARLKRQHHLEQRMPRQRARRIEHLHQPLERQIGMAIGRKVAAPHPADQLGKARVARGVGAQHQRVDEEPDQIVQRRIACGRQSGCRWRCRSPLQAASTAPQARPAAP